MWPIFHSNYPTSNPQYGFCLNGSHGVGEGGDGGGDCGCSCGGDDDDGDDSGGEAEWELWGW